MAFKPAHKDTDTPPGQIINPIDRSKTIGGIVDRVMRSEALPIKKKLTFEEWKEANPNFVDPWDWWLVKLGWELAQENV